MLWSKKSHKPCRRSPKGWAKDYEFRTTVVKALLSEENLLQIGCLIKGAKRYYHQRFNPRKTLDPSYRQKTTYTEEELKNLALRLKEYVKECYVRYGGLRGEGR